MKVFVMGILPNGSKKLIKSKFIEVVFVTNINVLWKQVVLSFSFNTWRLIENKRSRQVLYFL